MPSGKVHLRIELVIFAVCLVFGVVLWLRAQVSGILIVIFLFSYLFSSLFFSPDLDLRQSRAAQRWGIGRVVWIPYARIFRHRALSHHIVYGPLTRILYLGAMLGLVYWLLLRYAGYRAHFPFPSWSVIAAVVFGVYLPNQIHAIADKLWTAVRRH
jgi:uncharacterized metal-binding protein